MMFTLERRSHQRCEARGAVAAFVVGVAVGAVGCVVLLVATGAPEPTIYSGGAS